MALLFMDGFDKYGGVNPNATTVQALLQAGEWTTAGAQLNIAAPLSATGNALAIISQNVNVTKTLAASYGRLIGGFRFSSNLVGVAGIQFGDAGAAQASIGINTTGNIIVRNAAIGTGTILATSAASVAANSTHYLEFDISFGNAASYQVWLDGVSVLSGSGDTTSTANNTANGLSIVGGTAVTLFTVDDFYLFDASGTTNNAVLLTSPRIETRFPSGDAAVQFAVGMGILGSSSPLTTTTNNQTAASLVLRRFTPTINCTLNSITLMPAANVPVCNFRGVVYADSAGAAGALMSSGTLVSGATTGVGIVMPLVTPQSLVAGTQYWLGFIQDAVVLFNLQDTNAQGYRAANTFASGAPSTAPAMTTAQSTPLLWGNLTSGVNWYEVSQNPSQGNQSYVYDTVVGHEDLYTYPALTISPASTIYAVAAKANVGKSDVATKLVSVRMKSGATDSAGSGGTALVPGSTPGWLTSLFPVDPNTGAAWTVAALSAAQTGLKVEV